MKKDKSKKLVMKFPDIKWLTSHKILVSLIISVVYIIGVIIIPYLFIFNETDHTLEFCYYVSQVIAALFVVLSAIIALLQYSSSCNDRRIDRDEQRRIEAAKLARSFAEDAIPKINELVSLYNLRRDISKEVIWGLYNKKLDDFNLEEVKKIFPNYQKIKITLAVEYYIHNKNKKDNDDKKSIEEYINSLTNEIITDSLREITNKCNEVANLFEYYSICFNAGIIDNDTVYQSLHDAFIKTVHMIYIFVFTSNEKECDRLFYNTSELYKRWKKTYDEKLKEEVQRENEAEERYKNELRKSKKSVIVKSQTE